LAGGGSFFEPHANREREITRDATRPCTAAKLAQRARSRCRGLAGFA
jgi:hypothetical protein